jgi:hypothetical protein
MKYQRIKFPPMDFGETQLEYKKRKQAIRSLLNSLELCELDIERERLIADLNMLGYKVNKKEYEV